MLVRQLNVFLVIYLILHITAETMGKQKKLKTIIKNNLINIFGLLAFAGLFIINKGTAIGVQDLHPDFFISPGVVGLFRVPDRDAFRNSPLPL